MCWQANFLLSRWSWWQATAGEYPTEVPLPDDIRTRLSEEGLPSGEEILQTDSESQGELGPLLPDEPAPPLKIRGLPTREENRDITLPDNAVE